MTRIERSVTFIAGILTIGSLIIGLVSSVISMPVPIWLVIIISCTIGVSCYYLGRSKVTPQKAVSVKDIGTLNFDYLPDSPQHHGWGLRVPHPKDGERVPPVFITAADAPISGAMVISHTTRYSMDHALDQHLQLCNMVECYIQFIREGMLYLQVSLSTRDSSKHSEGWLCYRPEVTSPSKYADNEWSVPIRGEVLENGWISVRNVIPEDVSTTFGTEGWIYSGLKKIRIRGSLAISSIRLSRIELPNNSMNQAAGQR